MNTRKLKRQGKKPKRTKHDHGNIDEFQRLVSLSLRYAHEGNLQREEACYRNLLKISPGDSDVLNHLGNVLELQRKLSNAYNCFKQALANKPGDIGTHINLGRNLTKTGQIRQSIESYNKVIALHPNDSKVISCKLFSMNYLPEIKQEDIFSEAILFSNSIDSSMFCRYSHKNRTEIKKPIRIGYVSPDFRQHSVSYFLLPLLENHDRNLCKIYCYSDVSKPDSTTELFQRLADEWRPIENLSDGQAADLIYEDKIDILVDLAGHTSDNRLHVFAFKPAPLQISWLGYPNTTGLKSIDYRFTDKIADPEGEIDHFYSEKLHRLPHGFLCYSPPPKSPQPKSHNNDPKKKSGIVFGSFNNLSKINEKVIEVWSKILQQLPEASLFLKSSAFFDPVVRDRYYSLFKKYNIEKSRIEMQSFNKTTNEHLANYTKIDFALDTFPYNGTTTTCEALWMGVPVIALSGRLHAARVGQSILTGIGLECLIGETEDDYIDIAVKLAKNKSESHKKFSNIRERMLNSALCNPALFTKQIEQAYLEICSQSPNFINS